MRPVISIDRKSILTGLFLISTIASVTTYANECRNFYFGFPLFKATANFSIDALAVTPTNDSSGSKKGILRKTWEKISNIQKTKPAASEEKMLTREEVDYTIESLHEINLNDISYENDAISKIALVLSKEGGTSLRQWDKMIDHLVANPSMKDLRGTHFARNVVFGFFNRVPEGSPLKKYFLEKFFEKLLTEADANTVEQLASVLHFNGNTEISSIARYLEKLLSSNTRNTLLIRNALIATTALAKGHLGSTRDPETNRLLSDNLTRTMNEGEGGHYFYQFFQMGSPDLYSKLNPENLSRLTRAIEHLATRTQAMKRSELRDHVLITKALLTDFNLNAIEKGEIAEREQSHYPWPMQTTKAHTSNGITDRETLSWTVSYMLMDMHFVAANLRANDGNN